MAKQFDQEDLQEIMENAGPLAIIKLRDVLQNTDLSPQGAVSAARALSDLVEQMQGSLNGKSQEDVVRAIVWRPEWINDVAGLVLHFAEWGAIPNVPREEVAAVVEEWFGAKTEDSLTESSESPDLSEA